MRGIYLLLGSNRGQRLAQMGKAMEMIRKLAGDITCQSSVYETDPWGFSDPVKFLNMAIELDTELEARGLLQQLKQAERAMGRNDTGQRYQPRIIDIDILLFGSVIIQERDLIIPHPQLTVRRFALVPLNEIAPDVLHPRLKVSIRYLLHRCEDKGEVRLYTGSDRD